MGETRTARRIGSGFLSSGLLVGAVAAHGATASAQSTDSAPLASYGIDGASMASGWRSRLAVKGVEAISPTKLQTVIDCRQRQGKYLIKLQNNHVDDFAKTMPVFSTTCDTLVRFIGTDALATKNGSRIQQLDNSATRENSAAVIARYKEYLCGNCSGTWIGKHTTIYKKVPGDAIVPPDNLMSCNTIVGDNGTIIGWACLLVDALPVG